MKKPKLGNVYMFVQDKENSMPGLSRTERDFFVLAKSKNPNKPNTVGLWRVNPLTMTDKPNWRYRKIWSQTEVKDPNNLTASDLKKIMDPSGNDWKFIELSDESKAIVKAIYAGTKITPDYSNEFKLVTIYEKVF